MIVPGTGVAKTRREQKSVLSKEGRWVWVLLELEKEMRIGGCLLLLFSRWIVNDLNFCGNANLSRNTTDGIDYDFCPNHCDYQTPFWGQASNTVSETKYGHTKNDKCKITGVTQDLTFTDPRSSRSLRSRSSLLLKFL